MEPREQGYTQKIAKRYYRQFSGRRVRKLENVLFTTGVRLATSESRKLTLGNLKVVPLYYLKKVKEEGKGCLSWQLRTRWYKNGLSRAVLPGGRKASVLETGQNYFGPM